MNVKFQTINPAYRALVAAPKKRTAQTGSSQGNYDTVTIRGTQTDQEDGFARILSRTAASQLSEGASPERVQELGRQVAAGTYHPNAELNHIIFIRKICLRQFFLYVTTTEGSLLTAYESDNTRPIPGIQNCHSEPVCAGSQHYTHGRSQDGRRIQQPA